MAIFPDYMNRGVQHRELAEVRAILVELYGCPAGNFVKREEHKAKLANAYQGLSIVLVNQLDIANQGVVKAIAFTTADNVKNNSLFQATAFTLATMEHFGVHHQAQPGYEALPALLRKLTPAVALEVVSVFGRPPSPPASRRGDAPSVA